jgi:hypothetical protein
MNNSQPLLQAVDVRGKMTRELLLRLRLRLGASPLPDFDPVRLALDRELTDLATSDVLRAPRYVVKVHDDAEGDLDTFLPD